MAKIRITQKEQDQDARHPVMRITLPEVATFRFEQPLSLAACWFIDAIKELNGQKSSTKKHAA